MKGFSCLIILSCLLQTTLSQDDTSIATPPDGSSCWDNTTEIYDHLVEADPFSTNTYIMCPNTVYYVGSIDSQGECCENGEIPLAARTNTKYQCGEDGSSTNNCTVTGGTMQFIISPLSFEEAEATNVVVQGLTFTKAALTATAPALAGDFTFIDCIFEDTQNSGAVVALYRPANEGSSSNNRRLAQAMADLEFASLEQRLGYAMSEQFLVDAMADAEEDIGNGRQLSGIRGRELQQDICELYFIKTVFRNNTQGSTQGVTTYGLVTARSAGNFMSFDDCLFADNVFGIREVYQQGYAIESWGSDVEIRNTCFVENNFIGFGPVHVWDGGRHTTQNVYGDADDELTCKFLAASTIQPEDDSDVTCFDYDADTCQADIDPDLIPEPSPTPEPVATPSPNMAPSRAPSVATTAPAESAAVSRRRIVVAVAAGVVAISLCL